MEDDDYNICEEMNGLANSDEEPILLGYISNENKQVKNQMYYDGIDEYPDNSITTRDNSTLTSSKTLTFTLNNTQCVAIVDSGTPDFRWPVNKYKSTPYEPLKRPGQLRRGRKPGQKIPNGYGKCRDRQGYQDKRLFLPCQ
jgi:hypothetical protein